MELSKIINESIKKENIIIENNEMDYIIEQIIDTLKKENDQNNSY